MGPAVIRRSATISECKTYRWTLKREWDGGKRVCFIGLNPSTADYTVDDPTVKRWMHFAEAWGYGGFVAVNLYPFRSSSPADCREWSNYENNGPDWYARDAMAQNLEVVAREAEGADLVVACWGAGVWDVAWLEIVLEKIDRDIYCFGKTKYGDPIHPMARGDHRVPDSAQPQIWSWAR